MASFLTTLPLHVHEAVGACLTYFVLFLVFSPILSARVVPNLYSSLPQRTRITWNVRVVSSIQATFICASAAYVILRDESRINTDAMARLWAYSPLAGRVQAFAAGYFLWDLLISLRYLRVLGLGSLVHAISALLVTATGFVSNRRATDPM
jgi:TLC domain